MKVLNTKYLVYVYLCVPIFLGLALTDHFFLNGQINQNLPRGLGSIIPLKILFSFGHVIAGFLILFDTEYVKIYKSKILSISLFALVFTVLSMQKIEYTFIALFLIRGYHATMQNVGLALPVMKCKPQGYEGWKWSVLLYKIFIVLVVYANIEILDSDILCFVLFLPTLFFAVKVSVQSKTLNGKYYVWGNQLMLIAFWLLFKLNHLFLLILMTRIIHDITAYLCYFNHDVNRNSVMMKNSLYKFIHTNARITLPVLYLAPIITFSLSYIFNFYIFTLPNFLYLAVFFNIIHYVLEAYLWKGSELPRKSLVFS